MCIIGASSIASPLVSVPYLCYVSDLCTCICDAQSDDGMTCMSIVMQIMNDVLVIYST